MIILKSIKSATAENHRNLENSALMRPISDNNLTRLNYSIILKAFYGVFFPLENMIEMQNDLLKFLPDLYQRRKSYLILKDLEYLEQTDQDIGICADLPIFSSLSQAFGGLYVMEGSTLGGQFISRSVKKQLSLDSEEGVRFFSGYGNETGSKWKSFQEALLAYCKIYSDEKIIVESANKTFLALEKWFNKSYKGE